MTDIAVGFWPCKVLDGFFGDIETKPGRFSPTVRINVEVTDGEHKGQRYTYEEEVNNKQAPYITRTLKAVGWKCHTLSTVKADVAEWIAGPNRGTTTMEIKHIEIKKGKTFDKWTDGGRHGPPPVWVKVGSIGRGPRPIVDASQDNLNDADEFMRRAIAEDAERAAGRGGTPPDDDAPPPADDDIPFSTCSMSTSVDRVMIAKVLRW